MREFILWFVTIIVIMVVSLGFKTYKCHTRAASFNEVEYRVVTGCMVKSQGRWLPLENIKGFVGE